MRRTYPSRNFIVPSILVHSVIPSHFRTSHCSRLLWHTPLCLPTSLHSTITNSSSKSPPPFTSEAFPFCTVRCSHPPLFTVGAFSFRTAWCFFFYRQSFSICTVPYSLLPLFTVRASLLEPYGVHLHIHLFSQSRLSSSTPSGIRLYLPLPSELSVSTPSGVHVHLYLPSELSLSAPSSVYFHNL